MRLTRSLREDTREYIRLRTVLKGSTWTLGQVDHFLARTPSWLVTLLARETELQELLFNYQATLDKIRMNIDGKRLLTLGVKPGPQIGKIISRIRQAWLEGEIDSALGEEELVRKLMDNAR